MPRDDIYAATVLGVLLAYFPRHLGTWDRQDTLTVVVAQQYRTPVAAFAHPIDHQPVTWRLAAVRPLRRTGRVRLVNTGDDTADREQIIELVNRALDLIQGAHRDPPPIALECSGVAARWCDIHGPCRCRTPEESMSDSDCPLHSPTSPHPIITS